MKYLQIQILSQARTPTAKLAAKIKHSTKVEGEWIVQLVKATNKLD